jgi:acyl-CoA synthetase (AMP-forming)/AMP-acid ligase II
MTVAAKRGRAAQFYQGRPFEADSLIPVLLAERGQTSASAPYLTVVSAKGVEETLSYAEVDEFSRRLAGWFRSVAGAGPGTVVALAPTNDLSSVLAIFALLRCGGTTLLVNPADPKARLLQQINAAGAESLFSGTERIAAGLPGARPLPAINSLKESIAPVPNIEPHADAFLIGTSGSTAASKLVAQSHANAAANAAAAVAHHRLTAADRFLGCLPIHHVNGLHFTLFATLAAGAHAVLVKGFQPFGYARLLERFRPQIASVVPNILEALVTAYRGSDLPPEFRYFVSAAAPLPAHTARSVAAKLGRRVVQGYGLTETTNFSCTLPPDLPNALYRRLILEAEIPTVGIAFPGNEVAILGPDGARLPPGAQGEICMRGHNVMNGYANNPEATAEAFRNDWFHSQDIGFEQKDPDDGRSFFVITGRAKNMAKIRGETVSIDEMDRVLRDLAGIVDAACVARPHKLDGEEVIAVVVTSAEMTDEEIRAHLLRHFSRKAQPSSILRRPAIPRTPTGKVKRAELRAEVDAIDR